MTAVVGYPVHALATYRRWANEFEAQFTDWTALCGVSGTRSGHGPFGEALNVRRAELCPQCFPTRNVRQYVPEPTEIRR